MKSQNTDLPMFEMWLKERTNLRESSIYVYTGSLKRFLSLNPDIDKLEDYNDFLIKTTQRKKRANFYYSVLKKYIQFKIPESTLRQKLIGGLIRPIERDPVTVRRYLSDEKRLEVINYLENKKHKVLAMIQSLTGVRAGDILGLKRGSIVTEVVHGKPALRLNVIGKREKINVVYIFDIVVQDIILDYVNNNINYDDYYFIELGKMINRRGDTTNSFKLIKMNYEWYWKDLRQALQTAGVNKNDFSTHDFRRCFAREIWDKYKGDILILQNALNHEDPKTTLRYLRHSGLRNRDVLYEYQTDN